MEHRFKECMVDYFYAVYSEDLIERSRLMKKKKLCEIQHIGNLNHYNENKNEEGENPIVFLESNEV